MLEAEALKAARDFARNKGRNVSAYETKITRQGVQWQVEFFSVQPKPAPGDFFTVYLDDQSGSVIRLVDGK
jgi:hypothetical protein